MRAAVHVLHTGRPDEDRDMNRFALFWARPAQTVRQFRLIALFTTLLIVPVFIGIALLNRDSPGVSLVFWCLAAAWVVPVIVRLPVGVRRTNAMQAFLRSVDDDGDPVGGDGR